MNSYMAALEARGVVLGYTPVDNVQDAITIPDGAIQGLIDNMAVLVAPDYDAPISPSLARSASRGLNTLRIMGRKTSQTRLPANLPIGSGNSWHGVPEEQFQGVASNVLLVLRDNDRETVISAAATPVRVTGFWDVARSLGLKGNGDGEIYAADYRSYRLNAKAELTVTGDGDYQIHLMMGSKKLASVSATFSSSATDVVLRSAFDLDPDDTLHLAIEATGHTENAKVHHAKFWVR